MEERPVIDYLSKDFASFRQAMLDRLSSTLPSWQERRAPDLGITLVELLAFVGDYLSQYQDSVATEAYLGTARQRISVRRHARLLDYVLHEGCSARTWVHLDVANGDTARDKGEGDLDPVDLDIEAFAALASDGVPAGPGLTAESLAALPADRCQIFEPIQPGPVRFWPGHNCMSIVAMLDADSTMAVLEVAGNPPTAGDVLILVPAIRNEALPIKGHPVRVVDVTRRQHPSQFVVTWHGEDALPECLAKRDLRALGNNVLVTHGRTVRLSMHAADFVSKAPRFAGLTHRVPVPRGAQWSAARLLAQDPRDALADISLKCDGAIWTVRRDLFASQAWQNHFYVEVDDDGQAFIRFGDGECGRKPPACGDLAIRYRIGNGPLGNVPDGAITFVLLKAGTLRPRSLIARNPLPAIGGLEAESTSEARQIAAGYMRVHQRRAVSPDDYAHAARNINNVQQAVVEIRREGARGVVRVAVDPLDYEARQSCVDNWRRWRSLAERVASVLERIRRVNHDVLVVPPVYVDIRLEIRVAVLPRHDAQGVGALIRGALFGSVGQSIEPRRCLPDNGLRPMFHPDNQTFGQPVYWSRIVAAIHKVPGVAYVGQEKFERRDRPSALGNDRIVSQVDIGPVEVAALHDGELFKLTFVEGA